MEVKMRTFIFISLFVFLAVSAHAEDITITTYYPSPSGNYRDLFVSNTLTLESVPLNNDAPQILWNTSTSNISWNIDQLDNKLRFYSNDGTGVGRVGVSLNPETGTTGAGTDGSMELRGRDRPFNLILRGAGNSTQIGTISFQSQTGTEWARIWSTPPASGTGELFMSTRGSTDPYLMINSSGNVGIGTTDPAVKLDVAGGISASAGVKVGTVSSNCNSSRSGTMRYNSNSKIMEYCDGSNWTAVGSMGNTVIRSTGSGLNCSASVSCHSGEKLIGGGCKLTGSGVGSLGSYPQGNTWECPAWTCTGGSGQVAYAICLQ